jgi:hypothetical protein
MDPIRSAAGGPGYSTMGSELTSMRSAGFGSTLFSRAVVVEILGDLSLRTDEQLRELAAPVRGGIVAVRSAPRNSIIAQVINSVGASATNQKILCFPFFPPHISMPVKAGEHVWILQETSTSFQSGYWLCRVSEPNFVDDVNFTHADRRLAVYFDKIVSDSSSRAVGDSSSDEEENPFDGLKSPGKNPGPPNFANGPENDPGRNGTLAEDDSGKNPYDQIYNNSIAMKAFVQEAVPRFTKRPGDLVLQGSNNTLICLGQDRGWNALNRPDESQISNAYTHDSVPEFCGTIDIVSGRGRYFKASDLDPDSRTLTDTQARVILNERNLLETDKNSAVYVSDAARSTIKWNRLDRPQEGDPDFLTDASRIYISMRTNGDAAFNVSTDKIYPAFVGSIEDIQDSPFIVLKSDEVRIIARKETDRGPINGGIRLIKEGDLNGDAASIYLMPTGVIQISGNKVYLGQPDQGNGPGEKKSEPYVKYSELERLLQATYNAIDQFCQKLLTHTTPGYGSPSPQINAGAAELQTQVQQRKQEITRLKSIRVFGE